MALEWLKSRSPPILPETTVDYMKRNATRGDPDDVLRAIDEHCWTEQPGMLNVGDVKGAILDQIVTECNPTIAIELGAFIGYSAVRIARLLQDEARLFTIENDPICTKLTQEVIEHSGTGDKITLIHASAEDIIPKLRDQYGIEKIDFVFVDHDKDLYLPDLQRLLKTGLFQSGTVVLADNMIFPGCPGYQEFVRNDVRFSTETINSSYQYFNDMDDAMEKSVYLG